MVKLYQMTARGWFEYYPGIDCDTSMSHSCRYVPLGHRPMINGLVAYNRHGGKQTILTGKRAAIVKAYLLRHGKAN